MISVKIYFAVAEYHREKCSLCNIESNCDFLVKFCMKKIQHPCNIFPHDKAVTKK